MPKGTLDTIALELSKALDPLADRLSPDQIVDFLAELGLQFPPALQAEGAFIGALASAASQIAALAPLIAKLIKSRTFLGTAAALYRLWHSDALQLGGDDRRTAAGIGRDQVLDARRIQGVNALKKKINPRRVPIERKESYRWLGT